MDIKTGNCLGGPMDGQQGQSRYPKGFLLVKKSDDRVWLYDWNGVAFVCREPEGLGIDGPALARAQDEFDYDVRAYDAPTEVTA